MASFICKCNERLSNNMIPNDIQLWVYTDKEWDKIMTPEVIETIDFPVPSYDVWKCPKCERIHVFEEGSNIAIKVYALEETS